MDICYIDMHILCFFLVHESHTSDFWKKELTVNHLNAIHEFVSKINDKL